MSTVSNDLYTTLLGVIPNLPAEGVRWVRLSIDHKEIPTVVTELNLLPPRNGKLQTKTFTFKVLEEDVFDALVEQGHITKDGNLK